MDVVRCPEFNAGCNTGPGTPHWILTSVWPHCGIMDVVRGPESNAGCNAGAGTPYVILTSVWDPLRDHGRRAGPGNTCGIQCGALGSRRYSKRGLSSYVIQNTARHPQCVIRGLVRNPGGQSKMRKPAADAPHGPLSIDGSPAPNYCPGQYNQLHFIGQ